MDISVGSDRGPVTNALVDAVTAAGGAPSFHNTQPWRWRVHGDVADLYAEPRRQLTIADPDRRLLTLSCGAALHHACIALAAEGMATQVARIPEVTRRHHLASIAVTGRLPVTQTATRLFQAMKARHTDRRPLLDLAVAQATVESVRGTASTFGISLHVLTRDQLIELAAATSSAQENELHDQATRAELDAWSGEHRPEGAGVPDAASPDRAAQTTMPARDFGHVGTLDIDNTHHRMATYAILHGLADEPHSWLRGGEALSAIWLTATEQHLAVLPLSAAVGWPASRQALVRILSGIGHPYLALRLGTPDPTLPAPARTPRLLPTVTVEVVDD